MNIALIGYGKMGRMIEAIALEKGHNIVLKISSANQQQFTKENLCAADVAIEFTSPEGAYENVRKCLAWGVPVVSGSTGWNEHLEDAKQFCRAVNGSFLHASNFSIGVNIFFELNKLLAQLMAPYNSYDVQIKEVHHTQKKDAPSGTAVTLAQQVLEQIPGKNKWVNGATHLPNELPIISERTDPAPGTHFVTYTSDIDDIEIVHTAHNRKGFALGAVLAAAFIASKKGVFQMQDVLQLKGSRP